MLNVCLLYKHIEIRVLIYEYFNEIQENVMINRYNLQISVLKATTANNPCIKNPKVSVRSHFTATVSSEAAIVVLAKIVDLVAFK